MESYLPPFGMSDKNVVLLKPTNVTEMNQMIRLMINNQPNLCEICELTEMPILCRRMLKWPLKNFQISCTKFVDSCDPGKHREVSRLELISGFGRRMNH
ncbi:hypothetical protein PMAYCL1PPCAC_19661, partial [Pristionchus mayeri]